MKPSYQTFITEMLRHGDRECAYQTAYPKAKGKSITSAANRLLANPLIAGVINQTHNRIRAEAEAEIKISHKTELLNLHRVKQLLTQIAEGQHTVDKQVRTKHGGYETITVTPTQPQILSALRLYCRLEGWLMPATKATPNQAAPKQDKAPNPYLEEFRRIRKQSEAAEQTQPLALTPTPAPTAILTGHVDSPILEKQVPERIAEPASAQTINAIVPTQGYTRLPEILQDAWDIYIRNQTPDNWRRHQATQKLNQRHLPKQERTTVAASLGWECHPQDVMFYRRQVRNAIIESNRHKNQCRHVERS